MKPKPKSKKTSAPKTSRRDTKTKATRKGGSGRKGRTTEYVTPTIDTPSTPEPEAATSQSAPVERDADGREPIPGPTLVLPDDPARALWLAALELADAARDLATLGPDDPELLDVVRERLADVARAGREVVQ